MNAADLPNFQSALQLLAATPGYEMMARELNQLAQKRRILVDESLADRAQTGLLKTIVLGPEAAASSPLSLAQTLVHEQFHLHQNPLLKTVSFWSGIATRTPVMARFERPAYRAAWVFLEAVACAHSCLSSEARAEQNAIRLVFENDYRQNLL
jgi:hypothetical protein